MRYRDDDESALVVGMFLTLFIILMLLSGCGTAPTAPAAPVCRTVVVTPAHDECAIVFVPVQGLVNVCKHVDAVTAVQCGAS